jgi:hypothetical protein
LVIAENPVPISAMGELPSTAASASSAPCLAISAAAGDQRLHEPGLWGQAGDAARSASGPVH